MNREVVFINKAMTKQLRQDVMQIALMAIGESKPASAVKKAIETMQLCGDVYLISVGKAAWQMANTAVQTLKHPIKQGIVLTKYGHVEGNIPGVLCLEAGHPVPDENSVRGTQKILEMTQNLKSSDNERKRPSAGLVWGQLMGAFSDVVALLFMLCVNGELLNFCAIICKNFQ